MTRPRVAKPVLDGVEHGTYTAYNKGCGCERCRTACRDYHRARRAGVVRRVPRKPTARQRQAFQGSPYDPAKAERARQDRTRAPLTDAERATLDELLGGWPA